MCAGTLDKERNNMHFTQSNKRQYPRMLTNRPLKLFHKGSGRFLPATASDLSDGGTLVMITWPCKLVIGEPVDIYLPPDEHVMLSSKHRITARIVRVLENDSVCMAAIQFDQPLSLSIMQERRAAA